MLALSLDIPDAGRSPNHAVRDHAGSAQLDFGVDRSIARNAMTRTQRLFVTFYFFSVDRFV